MSEEGEEMLWTPRPGWAEESLEVKRRRDLLAERVLPIRR